MEAEIETEKEIEIEVSADVFASIAFPSCTCLLIRLAFVCVRFYSFFYCSWFTILCFRCTAMWFRFFLWVFFCRFCSITGYCKILVWFPMLYSTSLLLIYFMFSGFSREESKWILCPWRSRPRTALSSSSSCCSPLADLKSDKCSLFITHDG